MIKCVIFDFGDTLSNAKKSNEITQKECPELDILKKRKTDLTKEELMDAKKQAEERYRKSDYLLIQKDPYIFLRILLDELGIEFNKKLSDECDNAFWAGRVHNSELMPNAKKLLLYLKKKGVLLAVITNTKIWHNERIAHKHGLYDLFDEFVESHKFGGVKSELKIFEHFLEQINKNKQKVILPEECLMVGNNLNEDTAAKKIGMKTAILKTNIHVSQLAEIIEPNYYIDDLIEIKEIVEELR
jgi:FMN phosphatase YigB (HAD superfamily)